MNEGKLRAQARANMRAIPIEGERSPFVQFLILGQKLLARTEAGELFIRVLHPDGSIDVAGNPHEVWALLSDERVTLEKSEILAPIN